MGLLVGKQISYPSFVLKDRIKIEEETEYRFYLDIPFNIDNDRVVVVIMKNPSSADSLKCDMTISKVCNAAKNNQYGRVIIMNLFPIRATYASDVVKFYSYHDYNKQMKMNLDLIIKVSKGKDVVFAWGTNTIGGKRNFPNNYDDAIRNVVNSVTSRTFYADRCICNNKNSICYANNQNNQHNDVRYPKHGLRWSYTSKFIPY